MRLNDVPTSRRPISLTPLIDVVFLLLVFFMLASTFMKFTVVAITTAGSAASVAPLDSSRIALIHVGPDGAITVNATPVTAALLESHLRELHKSQTDKAVVVTRTGATVADLTTALLIVRRVPFDSIRVVD